MRTKMLLFTFLILLPFASMAMTDESKKESSSSHSGGQHHVSGTVAKVRENQIVVRVGSANKSYTFDDKTVFTYGDKESMPSSFKEGDQIVVTAIDDKAVEVNGTKHIHIHKNGITCLHVQH